jgi:hypothetical protein
VLRDSVLLLICELCLRAYSMVILSSVSKQHADLSLQLASEDGSTVKISIISGTGDIQFKERSRLQ